MEGYAFTTRWWFAAPVEAVWREISHPLEWPQWWRGVERVDELEAGDAEGRGSLRRFTWKSRLPYRLTFDMRCTCIETNRLIEGSARGELEGFGRWAFATEKGGTAVRYDWTVATNKPWMNWLAPVARPLFGWNHDVVMQWGETGLARRLAQRVPRGPATAPGGIL
jgi:hypothetical protein